MAAGNLLPDRWTRMIPHPEQQRLVNSTARHRVVAAGRGSGKTEEAMRLIIVGDAHHHGAACPPDVPDPLYVVAAPTRDQVKRVWWERLKQMVPKWLVRRVLDGALELHLKNGAKIILLGLDKPQRAEGITIDGLVVDEYAEVKRGAWDSTLQPACERLGRPAWVEFIGRPKGRNHFYDLWLKAKVAPGWAAFHWKSGEVLEADKLAAIRATTDELTYRQEYEADWVNFQGLAYYAFDRDLHCCRPLRYRPDLPLVLCFDFNVDPGVCAIVQEQDLAIDRCDRCGARVKTGHTCVPCRQVVTPVQTTCVIGEVYIPRNSNTPAVCRRIIQDWGEHKGPVYLYGDPAGGSRHTSQTDGSDWDQVRAWLRGAFSDLRMRVARADPGMRPRINALNSRLMAVTGLPRLAVDLARCPNVVRDFEGVSLLEGGSGEIDKAANEELSHLTDGLAYYAHERHPIAGGRVAFH